MRTFLRLLIVGAFTLVGLSAKAAPAPGTEQAVAVAKSFNDALIEAMKSPSEREKKLSAAIDKTFNVGVMTQLVVGAENWPKLSAADKNSVQAALRNYLVARFVSELGAYNNEVSKVDNQPQVRGAEALVKTEIQAPKEEADKVNYRLRKSGEAWKVVDVFYNGVSEMNRQRADLAAAAKAGGPALVAQIEAATRKLR